MPLYASGRQAFDEVLAKNTSGGNDPADVAKVIVAASAASTGCRTDRDGCPNAALLDEIGRCADATRQAYTDGVLVVIDGIAVRMAPEDPLSARVKALSLLGQMAGTLQLSRALTDRQLSDDLLEQGLHNALALVGAARHA
jgi:hypothetical protein